MLYKAKQIYENSKEMLLKVILKKNDDKEMLFHLQIIYFNWW